MENIEAVGAISYGELYEIYFNRVFKFVSYRLNNVEDAKDLTSEIFIKLGKYLHTYDKSKGKLDVWVFKVARNMLNNYYTEKSKHKIISLDKFKDFFRSEKYVEDNIEKVEEYEYLKRAVQKLPEREKEIISMRFGAELTNTEIAELTELSYSNVSVIIYRSIKRLKAEMEAYYGQKI